MGTRAYLPFFHGSVELGLLSFGVDEPVLRYADRLILFELLHAITIDTFRRDDFDCQICGTDLIRVLDEYRSPVRDKEKIRLARAWDTGKFHAKWRR